MASVLIVNPHASRVTPERAAAVARELERGGPLEVVETSGPWHARELAAAASAHAERIYVYSGDGGFNEALNGLSGDVPFGCLPGGGTSVLPRALGLPRDPVACARTLVERSRPRRMSLGRVNGRRFAFSVGIGLDAEAVRYVDERRRRSGQRPGDAVFVWAFARRLARGPIPPALDVEGRGRAGWVMILNGDPATYLRRIPIHVAPEARFELGLDLVAPRRVSAARVPRFLRYALLGRGQEADREVLYGHDLDRIVVRCDTPTAVQTDGEDLGDVDTVVCEAERAAVSVLVAR